MSLDKLENKMGARQHIFTPRWLIISFTPVVSGRITLKPAL